VSTYCSIASSLSYNTELPQNEDMPLLGALPKPCARIPRYFPLLLVYPPSL
jgi:hypothetical protein